MTQNYIKNNFDKKFTELESKAEWWVKEQGIKEIRELCTIDGELNAQNCFAVDYMAEKLDLSYSKIKKYLSDCRNENGVFDMSMLRTLKDNKTYVDKYGNANVTEVWNCNVSKGTESYHLNYKIQKKN